MDLDKLLGRLRQAEAGEEASALDAGFRKEVWAKIETAETGDPISATPRAEVAPPLWIWLPQAWAGLLRQPQWAVGLVVIAVCTALGTAWLAEGKTGRGTRERTVLHLTAFSPYSPETPEGRIYYPNE
jgi:hypothetical protein